MIADKKLPREAVYKEFVADTELTKCIVHTFVPVTNGIKAVIENENGKLDSIYIERLQLL